MHKPHSAMTRTTQAGLMVLLMAMAPLAMSGNRLRGTLSFGAESMTFTACGKTEALWLNSASLNASGWPAVQTMLDSQPHCDLGSTPCSPQKLGITGVGKISRKGSYGHLGLYAREVRFSEVQVSTAGADSVCQKN